jgi:hypothetical protein
MKISLVINTHNPNLEYLKQAIDNAIGFDEILVYFNNTLCNTIVEEYLPDTKNEYIALTDGNNRTVAEGFNYAISQTTGDWILPFCDDDYFITNNLKELFNQLNKKKLNKIDIIHYPCLVNNKDEWGEEKFTLDDIKKANRIPFSSIYRKSVWQNIGGYKNLPFNDWFFWMCAVKKQYNFLYYHKPIYVFRQEGNSLSDKERNIDSFDNIRQKLLNELEQI